MPSFLLSPIISPPIDVGLNLRLYGKLGAQKLAVIAPTIYFDTLHASRIIRRPRRAALAPACI